MNYESIVCVDVNVGVDVNDAADGLPFTSTSTSTDAKPMPLDYCDDI